MNILDEIFAHKREEVATRKSERPLAQVRREAEEAPASRDFIAALLAVSQRSLATDRGGVRWPALIAEIKRASPSRGLLMPDFDPFRLASIYNENGAAAISVLTDERYFQGRLDYLCQIASQAARPPLLRKDFTCDAYQVYEARAAGADAVLLISAYLDPPALRDLHALARELGMAALVEVHSKTELDAALECGPLLVGVNNRDLRDFTVRLETTLDLCPFVPPGVCLVAESGIHTRADISRLAAAGVDAILVGEALVTAPDVAAKVRSFAQKEVENEN